mgnify:CR=1 FL=1
MRRAVRLPERSSALRDAYPTALQASRSSPMAPVPSSPTCSLSARTRGTRYVLREVSAPDGYQALDPVTLLVYSDGRLALGADVSSNLAAHVAISEKEGTAWVTVTDDPVPSVEGDQGSANLAKTGGAPLPQAALAVLVASGAGIVVARSRRRASRQARCS